jgi:catechol 2,3-dioxygenase-like lactoylglutathione lyase family enzyme
MIETKGLAHFTIPVTDTVRSMAFYADILGMTPIQVNHERGMVFLDTGGDCVILAKSEAKIDPDDHDVHHAFVVDADHYEDAKKDLTSNGVDVFFEEDRQGGAVNGPRAYFHDPDGNVLEIISLTSYKGETAA